MQHGIARPCSRLADAAFKQIIDNPGQDDHGLDPSGARPVQRAPPPRQPSGTSSAAAALARDAVVTADVGREGHILVAKGLCEAGIEAAREVARLLQRHLCGGGQALADNVSGVAEGVDVVVDAAAGPDVVVGIGLEDAQAGVREDAEYLFTLGDHEMLDQRLGLVARGPDEHAVGDAAALLGVHGFGVDVGNVRTGGDLDAGARDELVIGVGPEVLVKGAQDVVGDVVDADCDFGGEGRVELGQGAVGQVAQLGAQLDAGGPAADDGDVQQLALALLARAGQAGEVEAIEELLAYGACVADRLHEDGVLGDAGGVEGVGSAAGGQDQDVIGDVDELVAGGQAMRGQHHPTLCGLCHKVDLLDGRLEVVAVAGGNVLLGEGKGEEADGGAGEEGRAGRGALRRGNGDGILCPGQGRGELVAGPAAAHNEHARTSRCGCAHVGLVWPRAGAQYCSWTMTGQDRTEQGCVSGEGTREASSSKRPR